MRSAEELPLAELVRKRVVWSTDPEHAQCWHTRAGLISGVVRKLVPSLEQKAEMLKDGGVDLPEMFADNEEVPRVWVQADPCPKYPRGCELAAEPRCLLVNE
jgi:hypothetical protein